MDTTTLFGCLAGFLTKVAFLPLVWKTWKSKPADDLSVGLFSLFSFGVLCWLIYEIMIAQAPVIFWNAVTLVLALVTPIMKLKFELLLKIFQDIQEHRSELL